MKYRAILGLLLALPGSSALSADFGFNTTAAVYVAVPLGARAQTSFTTWGVRFGEVDASGYSDERVYSPLNDTPTLSRYMSRPALWELRTDRWGIASFRVNGLETAERTFSMNAAGAITAASSSINWGMVAAGTAATVAVAAASSSSSGGSGSSSGAPSGGQPAPAPDSSSGSSSGSGGSSSPAPSQPAPAPAQTPPPRADDRDGGHNDDRNDDDHHNDHESDHDSD